MDTAIASAELRALYARDAETRNGLARDVHDIVGNAMTAIHLQARLALRTLEQRPAETAEALRTIASSSQRSLHELRSILGSVPGAPAPAPTLCELEALVATAVAGQLDVEVTVTGDRSTIPAAHDGAAYRIVQESLTNVLRHARATSVRVAVAIEPDTLTVEIADDGDGIVEPPAAHELPGQGIRGMRERAALLGGTLSAGSNGDSGFHVRATLPLPGGRGD